MRLNRKMSIPFSYSGITKTLAAFAGPFLAYNITGRVTPVLAGYKITHKCNLKCLALSLLEEVRERAEF